MHAGLHDELYGVPGDWTLRRCAAAACGLGWVDPCPTPASIALAYKRYYTHAASPAPAAAHGRRSAALRAALERLKIKALWLSRSRRSRQRLFLDDMPPGRVLDIGCGGGILLRLLRTAGWDAVGQEVDPAAAAAARTYSGCTVHLVPLTELPLADATFDAVSLSHVIEHVHDPVALLRRCHRLLKPGGRVVAITPNIDARGHARFGRDWRGLEPPRHLRLFSAAALHGAAVQAGLAEIRVVSSSAFAGYYAFASQDVRARRMGQPASAHPWLDALRFKLSTTLAGAAAHGMGEELVLIAVRPLQPGRG